MSKSHTNENRKKGAKATHMGTLPVWMASEHNNAVCKVEKVKHHVEQFSDVDGDVPRGVQTRHRTLKVVAGQIITRCPVPHSLVDIH